MRRNLLFFRVLPVLLTVTLLAAVAGAQAPALTLELSGINAIDLPQVEVTVNVYDALGQPLNGLTAENFHLSGPLAEVATIVRVENIANNALPFGSVLMIDASDSMAGAPIEQAKAAARAYVENVREIDPIAVVAFGSEVEVIQDYTTDRAALLAAIDSIDLMGRTALYQAAHDGINLADDSPEPRRAMVLLSDGAEYGGLSEVTPEEVIENAFLNGVPSYTIGLGYGADRSFLEQLAGATLAQFYESPTPDELEAIYQALADRLSSQYILTLEVNAPLDGAEYPFGLTVTSGEDSASQFGSVRAPIPVPIVDLSGLPSEPISTVTDLVISVKADQEITLVTMALNGEAVAEQTEPPYTLQIDPVEFPPGPLALDVTATDVDGDSGTGSATLEIAALPPMISLSRDVSEMGAINEPLEITVHAFGQTPITEVRLSLNGGEFVTLEPPYTFVLDPLELPPGDNHLDVVAVNEAGLEAIYPADFIMADVPPVMAVEGVSDGQSVDAPVSFSINAEGQTPVSEIEVTVNGEVLEPVDGVYTLDPQTVAPGAAELTVSATTDRGQTGTASVTLIIAPLPPVISVSGLEDGQTVSGDVTITLDAVGQTPVVHGMVTVNGTEVAHPVTLPATIALPFSTMQPGENTVEVMVDTQAGQSSSLTLTFNVPASLFTPTPDALATGTAVAQAAATRTAVAVAAAGEAATQSAGTQIAATESAITSATLSAATAQAQSNVTQISATEAAQAQSTQMAATTAAQAQAATQQAQASQTQAAATSTAQAAVATSAAQAQAATQQAQANQTQTAATAIAQAATQQAQANQTQTAATAIAQAATATPGPASATPVPATATVTAATATSAPATSSARATAEAASVLVQQAATNAGATVEARQTAAAQAQASTQTAATQAAQTTQLAATQAAQATRDAATQMAQATASAAAQAANATATSEARATAQVQTNQTATALSASISSATAQAARTATQQAELTAAAQTAATATARAEAEAALLAATQTAEAASTEAAAQTATRSAERAAATEGAQATRTARAVLAAGTATAEATTEATAEAQVAEPSHTPQPTLTPVEVEPEQGGGATTGLWAFFVAIILLAIALVVAITRMRKRRLDQ